MRGKSGRGASIPTLQLPRAVCTAQGALFDRVSQWEARDSCSVRSSRHSPTSSFTMPKDTTNIVDPKIFKQQTEKGYLCLACRVSVEKRKITSHTLSQGHRAAISMKVARETPFGGGPSMTRASSSHSSRRPTPPTPPISHLSGPDLPSRPATDEDLARIKNILDSFHRPPTPSSEQPMDIDVCPEEPIGDLWNTSWSQRLFEPPSGDLFEDAMASRSPWQFTRPSDFHSGDSGWYDKDAPLSEGEYHSISSAASLIICTGPTEPTNEAPNPSPSSETYPWPSMPVCLYKI